MSFETSNTGSKIDHETGKVWYHGSPFKLSELRVGSSITRNKELAIAFSHKPSQLSVTDEGNIEHNGQVNGYLYIVDEDIKDKDIYVHEACLEDDPWEWLTNRPIKLKLLHVTRLDDRK